MIDECGFDCSGEYQYEPGKLVVAVLPHPVHGRLTERVIPLVRGFLSFGGAAYRLCWRDCDVAYYAPLA